jgi:hypothetical protein
VEQSRGRFREALEQISDQLTVIDGDAVRWRYGAAGMLQVPLQGVEHSIIQMQLERTTALATHTQL